METAHALLKVAKLESKGKFTFTENASNPAVSSKS